jgi:hypothetical protein
LPQCAKGCKEKYYGYCLLDLRDNSIAIVHLSSDSSFEAGDFLMTANNIIQSIFYLAVLILIVKPLGIYMARIYEGKPIGLNVWFASVERTIYRLSAIKPEVSMTWKTYAAAVMLFIAGSSMLPFSSSTRTPSASSMSISQFIAASLWL